MIAHPPITFEGFSPEGLNFLSQLAANNNKEWFDAHKKVFTEQVQAPAVALVAALGERLQETFPAIQYDTRTNGGGSMMRIYRDTRFSKDKSPYKTNIAMMFTPDLSQRMEQAGFGLQITPTQVELVGGAFMFSKPHLEAFRVAVLDDEKREALDNAVAQVRKSGDYTFGGQTYKRVPAGYDADHEAADWLRYTGLTVFSPALPLEVAASSQLVDAAITHFMAMSPVVKWLWQEVG
jgi:uncharacterized protein (TIGR02453 family)